MGNPNPKLVLGLGFHGVWIEREERGNVGIWICEEVIGQKGFGFFSFDDGRVALSDLEMVAFAVVLGADGKTKAGGVNGYGGRSSKFGGSCCKFGAIRHQARDCNEGGRGGEAAAVMIVFLVGSLGLSPVFAHKVAVSTAVEVEVFFFFFCGEPGQLAWDCTNCYVGDNGGVAYCKDYQMNIRVEINIRELMNIREQVL